MKMRKLLAITLVLILVVGYTVVPAAAAETETMSPLIDYDGGFDCQYCGSLVTIEGSYYDFLNNCIWYEVRCEKNENCPKHNQLQLVALEFGAFPTQPIDSIKPESGTE